MSPERFEELVAEALDAIPDALARRMDNVVVLIDDRSRQRGLLGRYEGVPLTERDGGYGVGVAVPDRITIFRDAILQGCQTDAEVVREVAVTVVHEVAHHFGIDDARLIDLGWD
ncbi:MAG: metallopeptidase family protein [Acidimicrobiia bacterium]|nr:metallopeptidase family protein [Acidimicrobiia bacterium]